MSFARRVPGRTCSAQHEMIEDEQTGRGKFSCERARGPRAVLGNSGSLHHQNGPAQGGCAGAASSLETKGLGLSLSRESAAARTRRLIPARLSADGLPRFENRVRYLVVLEVGVSVKFYRCRHVDLGRVQKCDQPIDLGPRLLSAPQNAQERQFSLPMLGSQSILRRMGGLPSTRKNGSLDGHAVAHWLGFSEPRRGSAPVARVLRTWVTVVSIRMRVDASGPALCGPDAVQVRRMAIKRRRT